MIGVIVVPGPSSAMRGLDADRSLALLPLGDRPALQHIVESLVAQGVIRIEFIVGHAPERVEALFGNGDRWGSRFRYHLAAQPDRPYRSLKVIPELRNEAWVLLHAERYPMVDFEAARKAETTLYYEADETLISGEDPLGSLRWGGAVRFAPEADIEPVANLTPSELLQHFEDRALLGSVAVIATARWIDVSSPANLLLSQTKLLNQNLKGLTVGGTELQPNVWISRNVIIDPSANLVAPLYIAPNTRISRGVTIGPNTVIGSNCLIDSETTVENSLVLMGSYVGEGLELSHAVVARTLLVNVRLDTTIDVSENFLLGRLADPYHRSLGRRAAQSLLAVLLTIVFLPVTLLALLWFFAVRRMPLTSVTMERLPLDDRLDDPPGHYQLPCIGEDAWARTIAAGWSAFPRQFLPGLIPVIFGKLSLVGLPPRSRESIDKLDPEWRAIYAEGKGGLITEASVASADPDDEMQTYLADAYYDVRHSWRHDMKLAMRYFAALVVPGRR